MGKKRWQTVLATGLLLAIAAIHLGTLRRGHRWGDDFSHYVHHAKNLVEGIPYAETGYIYNPSYATIGPPCYPPLCPLLLAPVYALFGLNLEAMKLEMLASLVLFLGFVFLCLRRELPFPHALAGVLLVGLNRKWLGNANDIGSDLPFMALLYLALLVFQKAYDGARAEAPRLRWLIPAALLMYLAYATRVLGGLLLPAVLLYDYLRYRRITGWAVLAGAVFVVLAAVQSLAISGNGAYFDQYDVGPAVFVRNAFQYLKEFAGFWHNGYFAPLGGLIFLAVTALALLGYVSSLRRQATILEIFPAFYLAGVLLFPGYAGARYLQPIFPLYLLFALRGLEHPWFAQRVWFRRAALASLGIAIAGSYLAAATQVKLASAEGILKPESVALFDYVRTATNEDDVLVFIKPRAMSLLTSRRASAYHVPNDDARLWDYFDRIGATWLAVVENDGAFADAEEPARLAYLRDFARRNAPRLSLAFANADFSLYRIVGRDRKQAAPGDALTRGPAIATPRSPD